MSENESAETVVPEKRIFQTTIGDLVVALIDAAEEVSSDVREIEALAANTLMHMLNRKTASES